MLADHYKHYRSTGVHPSKGPCARRCQGSQCASRPWGLRQAYRLWQRPKGDCNFYVCFIFRLYCFDNSARQSRRWAKHQPRAWRERCGEMVGIYLELFIPLKLKLQKNQYQSTRSYLLGPLMLSLCFHLFVSFIMLGRHRAVFVSGAIEAPQR